MKCVWIYIHFALAVLNIVHCTKEGQESNSLSINLETKWTEMPFEVQLVEAISGYNESLYLPTVLSIINMHRNMEEEYDEEETDESLDSNGHDKLIFSDEYLYNHTLKKLSLDDSARSIVEFYLSTKYFYPRIQSHTEYFENEVRNSLLNKVKKQCEKDSFGDILEDKGEGAWAVFGNKIYCSYNDLFALRDSKSNSVKFEPFDRIIGNNEVSPGLILYGDIKNKRFQSMFLNLLEGANHGKFRFVWRYINCDEPRNVELQGYSADLSFKDMNYITSDGVIDSNAVSNLSIDADLQEILNTSNVLKVSKASMKSLGLKLISIVLSDLYPSTSKFELLKMLVFNFPKVAYYIDKVKLQNEDSVNSAIKYNTDLGVSEESSGVFINGSPLHLLELDEFNLFNKITSEAERIKNLTNLGFSVSEAKALQNKFALSCSLKQSSYIKGNSIYGTNENRYRISEYTFRSGGSKEGGVVFFNDIERDANYGNIQNSRQEAYLGTQQYQLAPGQIPSLRENIYDLIFAINLSDKEQLKVFFAFSRAILDNSITQQLGILPLVSSEYDRILAEKFYFMVENTSPQESLAFLFSFIDSKDDNEIQDLVDKIPFYPDPSKLKYNSTIERFSIDRPSVVCNGVIYDLRSTWQISMGKQIIQDVLLIKNKLKNGLSQQTPLKHALFDQARNSRNTMLFPLDIRDARYKEIDLDLIKSTFTLRKSGKSEDISLSFWIVGDCSSPKVLKQIINVLKLIDDYTKTRIQLRVLNTTSSSGLYKTFEGIDLLNLSSKEIRQLISKISTLIKQGNEPHNNIIDHEFDYFKYYALPLSQNFILLNGRFIRLDKVLTISDLEQFVEFESNYRLRPIQNLIREYNTTFSKANICDYNRLGIDCMDWFDILSSQLTKSFYVDDNLFVNDASRFDLSPLNLNNSIVLSGEHNELVDVLVVIDPIKEYAQEILAILESIISLQFIQLRILLQPTFDYDDMGTIRRIYATNMKGRLNFDSRGKISHLPLQFEAVPVEYSLNLNMHVPKRWRILLDKAPDSFDINAINLNPKENVELSFILKNILIEGYGKDVRTGTAPTNFGVSINNNHERYESQFISTLGYLQLPANPGSWKISMRSNGCQDVVPQLLSISEFAFDTNKKPLENSEVNVFNINGLMVRPRVTEGRAINEPQSEQHKGFGSYLTSMWQKKLHVFPNAEINVFSIASGKEYEKLMLIMIRSVVQNTKHLVKFWLLEDFTTPQFHLYLQELQSIYGFQYEFISYTWPTWLRNQRDKYRSVWGFKILFLDVLFPQHLNDVIFIDADQVVRADLKQLVDTDLNGAAYGFVPMCDSNKEMEGFRFWKNGYWKKVLQNDLKYHISALFKVDLKTFREKKIGDVLRSHYQKLSSDPGSLANLDQDLPNNLQSRVRIFSLPQEWLWCDTWCDISELKNAKSIDLCNNPKSNESKLERAQRLIPEWTAYNKEIGDIQKRIDNSRGKNSRFFNSDVNQNSEQSTKSEYLRDEL